MLHTYLSRLIALLLYLIAAECAFANDLVIEESRFDLHAGQHVSYLTLPENSGDPGSLLQANKLQQFDRSRHDVLHFGYGADDIWLALTLHNGMTTESNAVLSLDMPNLDQVDFHIQHMGIAGAPVEGPLKRYAAFPHPAVKLHMLPDETLRVLIRVNSEHLRTFAIHLQDEATFEYSQANEISLISSVSAALLLIGALALAAWRPMQAPLLLGFAGVTTSLALTIALYQAHPLFTGTWIGPYRSHLQVIMFLLFLAIQSSFTSQILDLRQYHRHFHHLLQLCSALFLLMIAGMPLASLALISNVLFFTAFITLPLILLAALLRWQGGFRPARWLLISRSIMLLVSSVFLISTITRLPLASSMFSEILLLLALDALLCIPALVERHVIDREQLQDSRNRIVLAETESRIRNEIVAKLGHDLRTPLNGILGMSELLEETGLAPLQQDYVRTISASGQNLARLIEEMMDFSRIDQGTLTFDPVTFDLTSLVNGCIDAFRTRSEEKSLELVSMIQSEVPHHLKGDPGRIRQVLSHLISNAIKYTEHGDVLVTVTLDSGRSDKHIRFAVQDTGPGIPRETLRQLFDQRRSDTLSQGIGLAVAQRVVKLMGGEIGANSQVSHGSTFWFSLPLEAIPEEENHQPFFDEQLNGLRMLVVDDNASCRLVIQQQATSWGMQVMTAVSGKQAMALLRSQANIHEPFDIVILDHDMPGMNGLELAAKLKEDALITNNVLVLMLTGQNIAPTATIARNAGIRKVLTKPVTGRILKVTLAEELGHLRRINASTLPPSEADAVQLSRMHVLVAEDHPLSQKVVLGMLHKLDIHAHLVVNGAQAVKEVQNAHYDLVLMDCDMPEMDGFEATRKIRQWERTRQGGEIPIIALTAHIMDEHKEKSLSSGMNAHLSKPIELNQLRDTLIHWMRTGKARPAS